RRAGQRPTVPARALSPLRKNRAMLDRAVGYRSESPLAQPGNLRTRAQSRAANAVRARANACSAESATTEGRMGGRSPVGKAAWLKTAAVAASCSARTQVPMPKQRIKCLWAISGDFVFGFYRKAFRLPIQKCNVELE